MCSAATRTAPKATVFNCEPSVGRLFRTRVNPGLWLRQRPWRVSVKASGFVAFGGGRGNLASKHRDLSASGGAAAVRGSCASPGCAVPGSNRRAQAIHGLLAPDPRTTASFASWMSVASSMPAPTGRRQCPPKRKTPRREGRRCKGISSERYMDVPRPRVGAGRATTRRTKSPCSGGPRPKRGCCPCSGGPCPKRGCCPCSGGPRPKAMLLLWPCSGGPPRDSPRRQPPQAAPRQQGRAAIISP